MSESLVTSIVTVIMAIIGVAIIAVLVSFQSPSRRGWSCIRGLGRSPA